VGETDSPKAVLISMDEYIALSGAPEARIKFSAQAVGNMAIILRFQPAIFNQ
jgi:hypothetical protein